MNGLEYDYTNYNKVPVVNRMENDKVPVVNGLKYDYTNYNKVSIVNGLEYVLIITKSLL